MRESIENAASQSEMEIFRTIMCLMGYKMRNEVQFQPFRAFGIRFALQFSFSRTNYVFRSANALIIRDFN